MDRSGVLWRLFLIIAIIINVNAIKVVAIFCVYVFKTFRRHINTYLLIRHVRFRCHGILINLVV